MKGYFKIVGIILGIAMVIGLIGGFIFLNNFGDSLFGSQSKKGIEVEMKNKQNEYFKYFDSDNTVKDEVTVEDLQEYIKGVRKTGFKEDVEKDLLDKTKHGIEQINMREEMNTYVKGLSADTVKSGLDMKNTEEFRKKMEEFKKNDDAYYKLRLEAKYTLMMDEVNKNQKGRDELDKLKKKLDSGQSVTISEYGQTMEILENLDDVGYAEKLTSELKSYSDKITNHNAKPQYRGTEDKNMTERNTTNNNSNNNAGNNKNEDKEESLTEVINDYK